MRIRYNNDDNRYLDENRDGWELNNDDKWWGESLIN
jgi:hypothetical protein